jgi:preprotein translocase subunit YajC
MLVGMLVVMYFFMIRPQKKQERELADMRNNIQIGDEIVTIGGIIGSVIIIKDDKIMIETGSGSKITILRSAVKTVLKDEEESK